MSFEVSDDIRKANVLMIDDEYIYLAIDEEELFIISLRDGEIIKGGE